MSIKCNDFYFFLPWLSVLCHTIGMLCDMIATLCYITVSCYIADCPVFGILTFDTISVDYFSSDLGHDHCY